MSCWRQTEITGKAADLYEPAQLSASRSGVLFLHGHGLTTLKDNPAFTQELERHGLWAVCPHGARSWWGDRVCAEFDPVLTPVRFLLDEVVPFVAETFGAQPPAIALLGVSMGGQGALRLAYRAPRQFPVVAALAPAIDFQNWHGRGLPLDDMYSSREAARQDTAILQIHPLNWPRHQFLACDPTDVEWYESAERLANKLSSTGIPFECDLETCRGGHSWTYFNAMAPRVVQFLTERLEQECRRLGTDSAM